MNKKLKIGIIGGGTVGGGVFEILHRKKDELLKQGIDLEIKTLCVRDINKKRNFQLPKETSVTADADEIINDAEIDMVVELMGGTTRAKDIVFKSLRAGKHVVTANKALVAGYLDELEAIVAEHKGSLFGFEASVAGGIPIINTIISHYSSDQIKSIVGILNGTTNFILSKMSNEGASYTEVLKEAQDLGFAEADPSADVDGYDARSKLIILAKLAWGINVREDQVWIKGIREIATTDFAYAKLLNSNIKLVAVANLNETSQSLEFFVAPAIVSMENTMAHANGATNVVELDSSFLSKVTLIGQGAGSLPTANSVVSDIIRIAKGEEFRFYQSQQPLPVTVNFHGKFYLRLMAKDQLGIIKCIAEICEQQQISIDAVHQLPIVDRQKFPFVITTDETSIDKITKLCEQMEKENFCLGKVMVMPILNV